MAARQGPFRCLAGQAGDFFGDTLWSYAELAAQTNRLCHVLTEDLGVVPGNRVLLRGGNSPLMFAAWLAVMKTGAIAVSTMPMLRARELQPDRGQGAVSRSPLCAEDLIGRAERDPWHIAAQAHRLLWRQ